MRFYRIPPVGEKLLLRGLFGKTLSDSFSRFTQHNLHFFDSGTSSLAVALLSAKHRRPNCSDVLIPAYCCPDVVSAIEYAELNPVLVDFEENSSFIDLKKLEQKLTANTLAVIAINFSGIKERISELKTLLDAHDVILIEDSAQLSPWRSRAELVADYVVVSFGRGKPESVLQGGGLFVHKTIDSDLNFISPQCSSVDSLNVLIKYITKIVLYNFALSPRLYALIGAIPFLHVGETRFKKLEKICGMLSVARKMLSSKLAGKRTSIDIINLYEKYFDSQRTVISLPARCHAEPDVLLRYPVLFPTKEIKQKFVDTWAFLGVSEMYPSVLFDIPGLDKLRSEDTENAISFAQRVATLPCHLGVSLGTARTLIQAMSRAIRD